jgi:hypothetical protein
MSTQDQAPTQTLTSEERQTIAEALAERKAHGACPACHENEWVIGDGYSLLVMRANLQHWAESGPTLPLVSRICTHCGYVSLHATAVLGVQPPGVA